ncbi:hypothetical protein BaRGS_00026579 [Batillaria attramentaria]|uniref:Uncharacterized protein n=1 Tax=Batillaria attramentaria TaxID=370345 RepID=A0ABD0K4V6_9CAEN
MESNGNENLPPTTMCRMGCGFYAGASFDGMCSKCYRDVLKRKQSSSPVSSGRISPVTTTTDTTMEKVESMAATLAQTNIGDSSPSPCQRGESGNTTPNVDTGSPTVPTTNVTCQDKDADRGEEGAVGGLDTADDADGNGDRDKKPKKNRCHNCRKKVGLTGFVCRCGGLFCSLHRYSDKHGCSFDYKEHGQEQIRRNNPIIVGAKIQKI